MALKARAHESDLRSGGGDQRQDPLQATGIDFSSLIEPYRGYGKLTLRLEQMPPRARFSAGMRAGERSWSLTPDDLNGLNYLLPDGTTIDHAVKVRVVGMERGDTLAVLDVKVARYIRSEQTDTPAPAAPVEPSGSGDQLAKAQSAVGALQIQLSDALAEIKRLSVSTGQDVPAAALESARAQWQAEEQRRFARAETEWKAQTQQQVDDLHSQLSDVQRQMQRLQSQQTDAAAAQLATARSEWKAEEARRLASAEADWARQSEEKIDELQTQLSDARKKHLKMQTDKSTDWQAEVDAAHAEWKADEAKRIARAEAQWAAKSRDRIEELEAQLSESVAANKRLTSEIAADGKADLDGARAAWKAEEVARLAQSESAWSQQIEFLKSQLAKSKDTRSTVDSEDLQAQLRQIRDELQTGFNQKLAAAESDWGKNEAARLRDVEANWQSRVQTLVSELQAERSKQGVAPDASDDRPFKDAIASLQANLAQRESDVERLTKQFDAERAARRKDAQDLRVAHETATQAEVELREKHATSLEQTEARWKQAATSEIKSATSRAELAESKLQELRAAAADAARLDKEVLMLRATLVERDQELHRLQHHHVPPADAEGTAEAAPPPPVGFKKLLATPYLREALVGAACTVATVLLVPAYGTAPSTVTGRDMAQVLGQANAAPVTQTLLRTTVVLRNTRLRAMPGKDGQFIVRVDRGVEVGVLKTEGGWTQVKMNHKTSVVEGWIESESLDLSNNTGQTPAP